MPGLQIEIKDKVSGGLSWLLLRPPAHSLRSAQDYGVLIPSARQPWRAVERAHVCQRPALPVCALSKKKRERAHTFRSGRQALAGRGQRSVAEVSVFSSGVVFSSRHVAGAFLACGWLSVAVQAAAAVVVAARSRVAAALGLAQLLALRAPLTPMPTPTRR